MQYPPWPLQLNIWPCAATRALAAVAVRHFHVDAQRLRLGRRRLPGPRSEGGRQQLPGHAALRRLGHGLQQRLGPTQQPVGLSSQAARRQRPGAHGPRLGPRRRAASPGVTPATKMILDILREWIQVSSRKKSDSPPRHLQSEGYVYSLGNLQLDERHSTGGFLNNFSLLETEQGVTDRKNAEFTGTGQSMNPRCEFTNYVFSSDTGMPRLPTNSANQSR